VEINCECFICGKRPSEFGIVADGLECDDCMNVPKYKRLKESLRMEHLYIVRLELYQAYISEVINFVSET